MEMRDLWARGEERDGVVLVPLGAVREAARCWGVSPREAEIRVLEAGACPARYERNLGTLGREGQLRLLRSAVAVAGCGGLGGYLAELLARAGVGRLVLADGDVFGESNLNRQLCCTEADLGRPKARVAAERVGRVNGAVEVRVLEAYVDEAGADAFLEGCDLAVDGLDNQTARRVLHRACGRRGIPFVHGAIGGFWAQVAVFRPGEPSLWDLWGDGPDRGVELRTGNPPFTPALAAAVQAAEAVKLLTGVGTPLRGTLLWFDLAEGTSQSLRYAPESGSPGATRS